MKHISNKLTYAIFIALLFGAIVGTTYSDFILDKSTPLSILVEYGAFLFVQTLKYLAIPMVLVSIIMGVINVGSFGNLGRIGLKTLLLFAVTTIMATLIALSLTSMFNPSFPIVPQEEGVHISSPTGSLFESIARIIFRNPLMAIIEGNMLHIILLALLVGALMLSFFDKRHPLYEKLDRVHDLIITIIILFMATAPIGVFCLMAKSFSTLGLNAIRPLASYVGLVIGTLLVQLFVVYPLLLKFGAKIAPLTFFKKIKNPFLVAFSTASSNATIPVSLEAAEDELKIAPSIASFVIPLGATINMDSLAISYGVAAVILASAAGIDLTLFEYGTIVILTVFASIGTAGVPGVGLLALAMVLEQVNIPIYGIPILMGVGRLNDMLGTAINVTGDIVVAAIVDKSENAI